MLVLVFCDGKVYISWFRDLVLLVCYGVVVGWFCVFVDWLFGLLVVVFVVFVMLWVGGCLLFIVLYLLVFLLVLVYVMCVIVVVVRCFMLGW